jgi:hypothetical protein
MSDGSKQTPSNGGCRPAVLPSRVLSLDEMTLTSSGYSTEFDSILPAAHAAHDVQRGKLLQSYGTTDAATKALQIKKGVLVSSMANLSTAVRSQ